MSARGLDQAARGIEALRARARRAAERALAAEAEAARGQGFTVLRGRTPLEWRIRTGRRARSALLRILMAGQRTIGRRLAEALRGSIR